MKGHHSFGHGGFVTSRRDFLQRCGMGLGAVAVPTLNGQSLSRSLPVTANGELLGVVTGPDLDFVNITVAEASSLHHISEVLTVAVVSLIAEEKILLTTDEHLEIRYEVLWQVATTEGVLDLGEDGSEGLRLDVLGGTHAES